MIRTASSVPSKPDRLVADLDGLLVALVLAPATYSRNRFFDMHRDVDVRRVRRRASAIRSIIRDLSWPARVVAVEVSHIATSRGGIELRYELHELGVRRTARLDVLELAVVRYAVDRACGRSASSEAAFAPGLGPVVAADRERIEGALARLRGTEPASPEAP